MVGGDIAARAGVPSLRSVQWPLVRLSRPFVSHLLFQLRSGNARGHHEALVPTVCLTLGLNCTWEEIDSRFFDPCYFYTAGVVFNKVHIKHTTRCIRRLMGPHASAQALKTLSQLAPNLVDQGQLIELPPKTKPNQLVHPFKCPRAVATLGSSRRPVRSYPRPLPATYVRSPANSQSHPLAAPSARNLIRAQPNPQSD